MMKKTLWLSLIASLPALAAPTTTTPTTPSIDTFSDDMLEQQLRQNTRQQQQSDERRVWEADASTHPQTPETQPQDTGEALYYAINLGNWSQARSLLEKYKQETGYDQDIVLLAEGALARVDGQWETSKQRYETLLKRHPDFTRGRLDLARLLFEGHLNREAKEQFAIAVQDPALPDDVLLNITNFRTALDKREQWQGSIQFGGAWNSNINESGAGYWCSLRIGSECLTEGRANPRISAPGFKYESTAFRYKQLAGHHGVFVRGIAYGRIWQNESDYTTHTLNASAGYQYENARHKFSLAPLFEWHSQGRHTQHRSYGVRGEYSYERGKWSWTTELEWRRLNYVTRYNGLDGHIESIYNTLYYAPQNDLIFFGGIDGHRRKAVFNTESYRQITARLGVMKVFASGFNVALNVNLRHRSYREANTLLSARRRDNETLYAINIGAERWKLFGFKPILSFRHTRVNSSNDWLYGYRQNEVALSLQKTF